MTKRLTLDPETASFKELAPAAKILLDGGLIAGPTESFYGLMALADKPQTLERLAKLKTGRTSQQPFLLLIDQKLRVPSYAKIQSNEAQLLIDRFWPGLLTLVFTAQSGLHPLLLSTNNTVGLRMEAFTLTSKLLRMVDRGLTGTSANPHQAPPPRTADEVLSYFDGQLDLVLDAGPTPGGQFSTLVDVSLPEPKFIRNGAISADEIQKVCPSLK